MDAPAFLAFTYQYSFRSLMNPINKVNTINTVSSVNVRVKVLLIFQVNAINTVGLVDRGNKSFTKKQNSSFTNFTIISLGRFLRTFLLETRVLRSKYS